MLKLSFETIAPFLSNPLVLIGFGVLLFFGVLQVLTRSKILPPLAQRTAGDLLRRFLRYGFTLAILVVSLGFTLEGFKVYRAAPDPPDPKDALRLEAKNAVRAMKAEVILLRGTYESVDDFGEPAAVKVRTDAPKVARRLLSVDDDNLAQGYQITKYAFAGAAFTYAAQADSDRETALENSRQAIECIDRGLALIAQVRAAADGTDPDLSELSAWLDREDVDNWCYYNRAIALAVRLRHGYDVEWSAIENNLRQIASSYLDQFPIAKNQELATACTALAGARTSRFCSGGT